jgi:hypothetical protein
MVLCKQCHDKNTRNKIKVTSDLRMHPKNASKEKIFRPFFVFKLIYVCCLRKTCTVVIYSIHKLNI